MNNEGKISFEELSIPPSSHQLRYLFQLLAIRKYPISHSKMPTMEEHCQFVSNHPYYKWMIVLIDGEMAGSLYFAFDNSVGLHVADSYEWLTTNILIRVFREFTPLPPSPSAVRNEFFFNVSPHNQTLIDSLNKIGCNLIQLSFSMPNRQE